MEELKYTGFLRLTASRRFGKTILSDCFSSGAYKPSRLVETEQSGEMLLYLMNPGGGFVDGDRYRLEITAEGGAELAVTTQSATKVYKTPHGSVRSDTDIRIAAGALLELIPDPVIAYESARYFQRTRVQLEQGAAIISADAWTPGWSPSGAPFTYERVDSLTELYVGEELRLYDRLAIVPARNTGEWDDFEGYSHYGSMLVVHDQASIAAQNALHGHLSDLFDDSQIRFGLTRLAVPGFMLRIMADSTEQLRNVVAACHAYIRQQWFGKSPIRLRK